ncbi:NADPH:quinone oxidoreductase family protein [Angustibacter sp. Root456]|uniref:NADPH:quinone oxidoreductase family protein n=1 Tax=Angustibacter sp. Root456 TaxID=1736539 RepID=UPI00191036D3|nr:NADPH:quinone oxidoreductase family protein [Angustibacter sp. Root456]
MSGGGDVAAVPGSMRAWQVVRHGAPSDALERREVPVPQPGAGELLVQVDACALNFPDVLLAAGQYQLRPDLPFTPGIELVGRVAAVGESVEGFGVGDRVIGMPQLPHGAFADYAILPTRTAFAAPEALDDARAASLYVAYQTGWFGLHQRARLQAGETVVVHAASGGVGSAAVQLAQAAGARVVAVVGGEAKAEVAWALGADEVVDRTQCDGADGLAAALKQACGPRGADVVYDPVGGDAFAASTKVVAFEGRIVVVGFTSGRIPQAAANHLLIKNYSVLGLHWGRYQDVAPELVRQAQDDINELVAAGLVEPLVSERVGADDVPDALQRLASGATTGRVVVVRG